MKFFGAKLTFHKKADGSSIGKDANGKIRANVPGEHARTAPTASYNPRGPEFDGVETLDRFETLLSRYKRAQPLAIEITLHSFGPNEGNVEIFLNKLPSLTKDEVLSLTAAKQALMETMAGPADYDKAWAHAEAYIKVPKSLQEVDVIGEITYSRSNEVLKSIEQEIRDATGYSSDKDQYRYSDNPKKAANWNKVWGVANISQDTIAVTNLALIVRGKISQEDYDTLTLPWRQSIGRIHPDDAEVELLSTETKSAVTDTTPTVKDDYQVGEVISARLSVNQTRRVHYQKIERNNGDGYDANCWKRIEDGLLYRLDELVEIQSVVQDMETQLRAPLNAPVIIEKLRRESFPGEHQCVYVNGKCTRLEYHL